MCEGIATSLCVYTWVRCEKRESEFFFIHKDAFGLVGKCLAVVYFCAASTKYEESFFLQGGRGENP